MGRALKEQFIIRLTTFFPAGSKEGITQSVCSLYIASQKRLTMSYTVTTLSSH